MAEALLSGLIHSRLYSPKEIGVSDCDPVRVRLLKSRYRVVGFQKNSDLIQKTKILLLAVKPQSMKELLEEIRPLLRKDQLIITIAAGLPVSFYKKYLKDSFPIVRTMPNNPALVRSGITALFAPAPVSQSQKKTAEKILAAVGKTVWVFGEKDLDAVTAVSGSGPAYFYAVFESMIRSGQKMGLSKETVRKLVLETALGAAKMAIETGEDPKILRQWVTSKKGTTEAAFKVLDRKKWSQSLEEALKAAKKRSRELQTSLR